ncbi:WD repeat protein with Ser/Thr protein kinase motif protein [Nostoc sp. NIES-3756]|uniref:serine/threonine-protein kinase n=1 Tax=Nostoc sp. NIES-3756 TaxID=1751286 RepID=UPI0007212DA3|nr:serine/threonine-protein kinase [Nostoc sp. NIES-3756]BAT54348.1 WD repeat protein with Ser/Thr protein kinase motif protein [Nostoc sp. NIES-3756]
MLELLQKRYRLLNLISRGGLCLTYLAIDEDQTPPVLCVVQQLDDVVFEQKVQYIKEISEHPQLPTLLDYFPENDRYYLVEELIGGNSLAQLIEAEGAFNESQVWQLLTDLLPVVKFMGDRQIIHGDIKPQNIIRPSASDTRNLVLVDFANMRIISEVDKRAIGSPEYAAPEQIKGEAVFASDLYSLGVTCIYLLTQLSPFDLYDVANDCWVWQEYLPTRISDRLSKILDKLVQKSIHQRYQSADEVMLAMGIEAKTPNYPPLDSPWRCLHTLTGHCGNTLAISQDGNALASGGDDKIIKLWDLKTQKVVNSVMGHAQAVTSIAFSPQEELLATASDDKTIKLWHLPSLQEIATLNGHSHAVKSISFSPDGKILASGGWDKQVKLWDVSMSKEIFTLEAHQLQVSAVAFSPQGEILASASFDRTVRLWQMTQMLNHPRCALIRTLCGHTRAVLAIAFSPDGKILATGSDDNTIKLWDVNTGQLISTLLGHSWSVVTVAFSADNETLVSGSWDKTIKLWKVSTTQEIATLASHLDSVCAVAVNPVAQLIASGSRDKTIKLWKLVTQQMNGKGYKEIRV